MSNLETMMGSLGSVDIHTIRPVYKQVQTRFPRSKKKRIRKKWTKDPRNWASVHDPQIFLFRPPGLFGGSPGPEMFVMDDISFAEFSKLVKASPVPTRTVRPVTVPADELSKPQPGFVERIMRQSVESYRDAFDREFLKGLKP